MPAPRPRSPLLAVLWFVAAALAFLAVGIRYSADGELNVPIAAAGMFSLVMAIVALARGRDSAAP